MNSAKQNIQLLSVIIMLLACVVISNKVAGQVAVTSGVYKELKSKDSLLFTVGFNKCELNQFEDLLSEDFEFYHDKVGIDKSKASFINSIKNGLCGTGENSTRRELIES
ncbi:MAG: nuclear transport factor 2 family protein, partial [Bacteroidota bacterium]